MTFTTRVFAGDPPDLIGRSPEDYARGLEDFLRRVSTVMQESVPAGFNDLDPEHVTLDPTLVSPGSEANGWAASDHIHWLDLGFTAKGDTLVYDGGNYVVEPVGTNGDILYADSTQATGRRWDSPPDPLLRLVARPAQITASQNDYNVGVVHVAFLDLNADWSITGFLATGVADGWHMEIWNVSASILTITHEDAGSAVANRVTCQGGANLEVKAGFSAGLTYDSTIDMWRGREE